MLSILDRWLFDSSGLTPHGFCLLWEPGLIWTYAISDTAIALAYFTIPVALAVIARRRRDLVFRPLLWLFAAFILLCGTTHWLDLFTLWVPLYGLEGLIKAATAIVSIVTALATWRLLPQILALPSPAQFRETSAALLASREQLVQAQKMEAVGQLTGGIAHDFNNMLQAVTSGLALLERRIAQGRVNEAGRYIAAIRQAAENATSLTNRLLAFSRRQTLQPQRIEPDSLVRNMEVLLRRTLGPEVRLELRLGDGRWSILCDPNQMESALLNLAINARDAMPDGGALTIVTTDRTLSVADLPSPEMRTGDYVVIEVVDTGSGMTPEILSRVFEPFFTTKPTGQGTGLGLSQVYGFVHQSGGLVQLDSRPGEGTAVRIFMPGHTRVAASDNPEQSSAAPDDAAVGTSQRGRVLVVEDQEDVRAQIVEVLVELGLTVIEAHDGSSGLRLLQSPEVLELLISDVGLPGLNGRQLADAARALRPDLPVLLITGYAGKALDTLQLAPGIELLRKPFSIDDLSARILNLLSTASSP